MWPVDAESNELCGKGENRNSSRLPGRFLVLNSPFFFRACSEDRWPIRYGANGGKMKSIPPWLSAPASMGAAEQHLLAIRMEWVTEPPTGHHVVGAEDQVPKRVVAIRRCRFLFAIFHIDGDIGQEDYRLHREPFLRSCRPARVRSQRPARRVWFRRWSPHVSGRCRNSHHKSLCRQPR